VNSSRLCRTVVVVALLSTACGSAANTDGSHSDTSAAGHAGDAAEVPFEHPDLPTDYVPKPGNCGFDSAAFCDDFEGGAAPSSRSGELAASNWSVARGMPQNAYTSEDVLRVGPALIGQCRAALSNTRVLPDSDVLVCDPIATIPSRHVLATAAAQNYGLSTYRIRQPFDFAGRTGTIKLDMDLSNNGLGGWPALVIAEDPSPAPSFDWQERGSGPRNGIEIEFGTGWCNTPHTLEAVVYTFTDYVQTAHVPSFDCAIAHALTAPDSLNHVEVYLTQKHVEVWTSDASADGVDFPNQHLLWQGDLDLPFTRGYVSLALRNHATLKYWLGSAANLRWDNIGFDGPVIRGHREYSAPDSLTPYTGLQGCKMGGDSCSWEGDVIPKNPDDSGRVACAESGCTYQGEGRNVGYMLPNVEEDAPPVALDFQAVSVEGAARARLILAASYPWFEWNGVIFPPTHMLLRLRVNGGSWHERPISEAEVNAFTDYFPELGGAGASAGLLNQAIDLELSELKDGDNRIELQAAGTWTGSYRVTLTGADLVLDQPQ
jgi:hypothetical protein